MNPARLTQVRELITNEPSTPISHHVIRELLDHIDRLTTEKAVTQASHQDANRHLQDLIRKQEQEIRSLKNEKIRDAAKNSTHHYLLQETTSRLLRLNTILTNEILNPLIQDTP